MPNYFYVEAGGLLGINDNTGYSTIQTGTFPAAANCYDNWYDAIMPGTKTTPFDPSNGDLIISRNTHSKNHGANITITPPNNTKILSVDGSNCDQILAGASEEATGGIYDYYFTPANNESLYLIGATVIAQDNVSMLNYAADNQHLLMRDGTIKCTGTSASDQILMVYGSSGDNNVFELINVSIQLPVVATGNGIQIQTNNTVLWQGGSILSSAAPSNKLFTFGAYGGKADVVGVDLSNLATSATLVNVTAITDERADVTFVNCKFPTSYVLASTLYSRKQRVEAYGCGTGDEYYAMQIADFYGTLISDTSIYRDDALTYDQTNRLSLKVTPNANCISGVTGFRFNLPCSRYLDLTSSTIITVYLVIDNTVSAATALNDNHIVVRVKHTDATNNALNKIIESDISGPLKTGTTLTTSTKAWTGPHATNSKKYEIPVTIPAQAGVTNGLVEVEIEVMADSLGANDDLYFCPFYGA